MRLFFLQSTQNNATYHSMNPDADITYQSIYLVLKNVLSTSFLKTLHLMKSAQHCLCNSGKGGCTQ